MTLTAGKTCDMFIPGSRGVQAHVADYVTVGASRLQAPLSSQAAALKAALAYGPLPTADSPETHGCKQVAWGSDKVFTAAQKNILPDAAFPGGNVFRYSESLLRLDGGGVHGSCFGAARLGLNSRSFSRCVAVRGNTVDHGSLGYFTHAENLEVTGDRACDSMGLAAGMQAPLTRNAALGLGAITKDVLVADNEVAGVSNPCRKTNAPPWCTDTTGNGTTMHTDPAIGVAVDVNAPIGLRVTPGAPYPFRVGHNVVWQAEIGLSVLPSKVPCFGGFGEVGLWPVSMVLSAPFGFCLRPVLDEPALLTSANLLSAGPDTLQLVSHRFSVPLATKAGHPVPSLSGRGLAQLPGVSRLAVATESTGVGAMCAANGMCEKKPDGTAGKRIAFVHSSVHSGGNGDINFTTASCLWNSPSSWGNSALAKCFGTSGAASGYVNQLSALDSQVEWLGGQADAGAVCCGSAEVICPMTHKWLLNQDVKCQPANGSAPTNDELSCRTCAADPTKAECNFFGPKFIPKVQDTCKFGNAPLTVVAQCPSSGYVVEPLALVGTGTASAPADPDVCAGFRCPGGAGPEPSCAALTSAVFMEPKNVSWILPCPHSICGSQADKTCGFPFGTASCPSGAPL